MSRPRDKMTNTTNPANAHDVDVAPDDAQFAREEQRVYATMGELLT